MYYYITSNNADMYLGQIDFQMYCIAQNFGRVNF